MSTDCGSAKLCTVQRVGLGQHRALKQNSPTFHRLYQIHKILHIAQDGFMHIHSCVVLAVHKILTNEGAGTSKQIKLKKGGAIGYLQRSSPGLYRFALTRHPEDDSKRRNRTAWHAWCCPWPGVAAPYTSWIILTANRYRDRRSLMECGGRQGSTLAHVCKESESEPVVLCQSV